MGSFWDYRIFILKGLGTTVALALISQAMALAIAIPLAVGRISRQYVVRMIAGAYVEFIRGTPALVQVFWIYYCIPIFLGYNWSPLMGAVIAFGLNVAAYDAEVIRAGIQGVHPGQMQAARALGLSRLDTFVWITLPQALRMTLPALLNNFIGLVLLTSLASTIGVEELTYVADKLNVATLQSVTIFTGTAVIYLAVSILSSSSIRRLERVYAARA